jgi:hypothetical protein
MNNIFDIFDINNIFDIKIKIISVMLTEFLDLIKELKIFLYLRNI